MIRRLARNYVKITVSVQEGGYFFILKTNPIEYKSMSAKMKYISIIITLYSDSPSGFLSKQRVAAPL